MYVENAGAFSFFQTESHKKIYIYILKFSMPNNTYLYLFRIISVTSKYKLI